MYKQAYPTPITPLRPTPLLGIDRDLKLVGDHQELFVRGTVHGYDPDNKNPPQGIFYDFMLDSDRPDNAQFAITGGLLTLRSFEGKRVEVLLKFPLDGKDGVREILSIQAAQDE